MIDLISKEDKRMAVGIGQAFNVSYREKNGQKWELIEEGLSLSDAVNLVSSNCKQGQWSIWLRDFSYWKSVEPALFNSDILALAIEGYI